MSLFVVRTFRNIQLIFIVCLVLLTIMLNLANAIIDKKILKGIIYGILVAQQQMRNNQNTQHVQPFFYA